MTQQLSNLDFNNQAKIINLVDGTAPQDGVNFGQLLAAVEGRKGKDPVVARASSNINISAPGTTIDGITAATGDRYLLDSQTLVPTNGIYIYNGPSTPMTRSLDANTASELTNAVVAVAQGTSSGVTYRQTAVVSTLGTDDVVFGVFGSTVPLASEAVAGRIEIATQAEADAGVSDSLAITPAKLAASVFARKKFPVAFGDGSATQYTITHGLSTDDVTVEIYRNSGTKDTVVCDVERTSINAVRLSFAVAPTTNQYRVVVIG